MNDIHLKVTTNCLTSLTKLFTIYKQKLPPYVDLILPKLLTCLTANKQAVHTKANFLMNVIQKIIRPSDLLDCFVRVIGEV